MKPKINSRKNAIHQSCNIEERHQITPLFVNLALKHVLDDARQQLLSGRLRKSTSMNNTRITQISTHLKMQNYRYADGTISTHPKCSQKYKNRKVPDPAIRETRLRDRKEIHKRKHVNLNTSGITKYENCAENRNKVDVANGEPNLHRKTESHRRATKMSWVSAVIDAKSTQSATKH